jgi:hypothetical protein
LAAAVAAVSLVLVATRVLPWQSDRAAAAPAATPTPGQILPGTGIGSATDSDSARDPSISATDLTAEEVVDDLPPSGQVAVLPRGTRTVGTFRTGYPLTLRGAVAAAVEYTGHGGCLDAACVQALTQATRDAAWTDGPTETLAGARKVRALLGIPDGQPVPAGTVFTPTPMAYQVTPVRADTIPAGDHTPRVRVMLLVYVALAGPAISPRNLLLALPSNLHWTGGDWKLTAGDGTYPELVAEPGTPRATALGWRDFAA